MKPHDRNTGFTLLELLVVIAIIAVLTALLLPALSSAKSSALSGSCRNHLRQMAMALQMYVHDNQNRYPRYLGPGDSSNGDAAGQGGRAQGLIYWSSKLFPYHPLTWTNTSLHCAGYHGTISGQYAPGAIDRLGSYSYNAFGARIDDRTNEHFGLGPVSYWRKADGSLVPSVSESAVAEPSQLIAMADALMKPGIAGGDDVGKCGGLFASELAAEPYVLPHGKAYNFVLCDGHVSSLAPSTLFTPSNAAAMWNYDHQPHPELWTP